MKIAPLTMDSINQVFSNLSEISTKDMDVFDISYWQMKEGFVGMVNKPWAFSFCTNEGECCALLIGVTMGEKKWRVYFVDAKGKLGLISVALTKFLKEFSDTIIKDGGVVELLSAYRDGKPRRWFETLGFSMVESEEKTARYVKGE